MYQYRQIIFRLRQGESIRGISRAKLADRKKVRQIQEVSLKQGWLNPERNLPTDEELSSVFKPQKNTSPQPMTTAYQAQIEE